MMTDSQNGRKVRRIGSRKDEVIYADACIEAHDRDHIWCPRCRRPEAGWDDSPFPIDLEIERAPQGCVARISQLGDVYSEPLFDVLRPYLPDGLDGTVVVNSRKLGRFSVPYRTYFIKRAAELGAQRPPDLRVGRDTICAVCGRRELNFSGDARVLSERDWAGRRLAVDRSGALLADDELVRELQLKGRFPDIRFEAIELIPDPDTDRTRFRYKFLSDLVRAVHRLVTANGDDPAFAAKRGFVPALCRFSEDLERPLSQLSGTGNEDIFAGEQVRQLRELLADVREASRLSTLFLPHRPKDAKPAWVNVRRAAGEMVARYGWSSVPAWEEFEVRDRG
jgi:hypothetical protein